MLRRRSTAKKLDGKVAIVRVEELSPFPFQEVRFCGQRSDRPSAAAHRRISLPCERVMCAQIHDELGRYQNAKTIKWVQEEPQNMGAWTYVEVTGAVE